MKHRVYGTSVGSSNFKKNVDAHSVGIELFKNINKIDKFVRCVSICYANRTAV